MKSHYFCLLFAGIVLFFSACQKNQDNLPPVSNDRDAKVTKQLRAFQKSLQLKSTNPMTEEDATWHIEGLLNLEKAYNLHNFANLQFHTDSIVLTISNGMLSGEQIEMVYDYFESVLNEHALNQTSTFGFDIIDIHSMETELKDGSIIYYMESSSSEDLVHNYVPFGQNEHWYWGWDLGGCNGYTADGDAAQQLEYKFNHPSALLQPGYFTSNQTIYAYYYEYDDFSNPGPNGDYKIFCYDSFFPPVDEPCLSPEELNFYLGTFDYIKTDKQPPNKTFKCVSVTPTVGLETEIRTHEYALTYGIFTTAPIDD